MQKWVYDIITFENLISEHQLNKFGAHGWELVGVVRPNADEFSFVYYFKKPATDPEGHAQGGEFNLKELIDMV